MSVSRKGKVGLDETRALILGAQILLGFQLQGVFRPVFDRLPWHDRYLDIASLLFSPLTVAPLISPSLPPSLQLPDRRPADCAPAPPPDRGRGRQHPSHPPHHRPVRQLGSGSLCR